MGWGGVGLGWVDSVGGVSNYWQVTNQRPLGVPQCDVTFCLAAKMCFSFSSLDLNSLLLNKCV